MNSNHAPRWDSQLDLGKINWLAICSSPKNNGPLVRQPWYFANQSSLTASTVSFEEIGLRRALSQFASYFIENSKDIEPEYVRIVEENFWDLLA